MWAMSNFNIVDNYYEILIARPRLSNSSCHTISLWRPSLAVKRSMPFILIRRVSVLGFDNGAKLAKMVLIVINFSGHYSQKGGMYVATLNTLSRLQGSAAYHCLCTSPLEEA